MVAREGLRRLVVAGEGLRGLVVAREASGRRGPVATPGPGAQESRWDQRRTRFVGCVGGTQEARGARHRRPVEAPNRTSRRFESAL